MSQDNETTAPSSSRAQLTAILQAGARIYMHIADAALESGHDRAEPAIRAHLRGYGRWRGEEMRQVHAAIGEPIDMKTLMQRWDSASTYVVKDEMAADGIYSPDDVQFDVHYCPAALAWKEAGFRRWGHVYCDEVHQAIASSYHPDGVVVIPVNMMKGDSHCEFRWVLPGSAQTVDQPMTELGSRLARIYPAPDTDPELGVAMALERTSRLIAGRFWTFATALGQEGIGNEVLAEGLRRWARQRGELLAKEVVSRTPQELLANMDFAPTALWQHKVEQASSDRVELSVTGTPFDEMFQHYHLGQQAALFWDSFAEFVTAFSPDLACTVSLTSGQTPGLASLVIHRTAAATAS